MVRARYLTSIEPQIKREENVHVVAKGTVPLYQSEMQEFYKSMGKTQDTQSPGWAAGFNPFTSVCATLREGGQTDWVICDNLPTIAVKLNT